MTQPAAVRAAFRRHFLGREGEAELDGAEQGLLHCLLSLPREQALTVEAAQ